MSYGVNRASTRSTTRRKKRRQSSGRVRGAGKAKSRGTSTRRATSARSAAKKSRRKRASKASSSKRTSSPSRRTKAKKPRLYTRYDPETGQKVRVTSDTFEYRDWPSRKPSKKKQQRAALLANPVGTLGMIGAVAGKKSIERAGETAVRTGLRQLRNIGLAEAGLTAAGLGAAATSGAILAAGYVVMDKVAGHYTLALGDKLNAISNRFVETQRQLIAAFRGRSWADVPADVREKALRDYKRAISTASAQGRGSANVTRPVEGSYK